jgi:hypothetical protein
MGSPDAKITVERRGQIVLIGINRPRRPGKRHAIFAHRGSLGRGDGAC